MEILQEGIGCEETRNNKFLDDVSEAEVKYLFSRYKRRGRRRDEGERSMVKWWKRRGTREGLYDVGRAQEKGLYLRAVEGIEVEGLPAK